MPTEVIGCDYSHCWRRITPSQLADVAASPVDGEVSRALRIPRNL